MKVFKITIVIMVIMTIFIDHPAYAHGFGERYDLPVPLWLYITGAGATVAFSFLVIALLVKRGPKAENHPLINLLQWRIGRVFVAPKFLLLIQISSVALFVLVIVAGLFGNEDPRKNIAPTLIWIIWWVGIAYISALFGNIWALTNPWRITFGWVEHLYRKFNPSRRLNLGYTYSNKLGVWPSVALFFIFAWIEIVYNESAVPSRIAQIAIIYSLITWGGMLAFGKETWLRKGEIFSLAFGLLAKFSPIEARVTAIHICNSCSVNCRDLDGNCIDCGECLGKSTIKEKAINLRPYAIGLLKNENPSLSLMVFVILMLATVTFDGLTSTPLWTDIYYSLYTIIPNTSIIGSIGIVILLLIFILIYGVFAILVGLVTGNQFSYMDVTCAFVYSLIPIALAYHLAHFLSFLLIQGQLIIPLFSDPLGLGWNLFGSASYSVNLAIINARVAWVTAVTAIVVGHIVAVYLAHVIALRMFPTRQLALRSQYPLILLMVSYTMLSLWILAQPIVEIS